MPISIFKSKTDDPGTTVKTSSVAGRANSLSAVLRVTAFIPEPGTIMLRKLDVARLEELIAGADRIKWHLNANENGGGPGGATEEVNKGKKPQAGIARRYLAKRTQISSMITRVR